MLKPQLNNAPETFRSSLSALSYKIQFLSELRQKSSINLEKNVLKM